MRRPIAAIVVLVVAGLLPAGHTRAAGPVGPIDVTFDLPLPAVTGADFTIAPVYPDGFALDRDRMSCWWELEWGDERSLRDRARNDTYGMVQMNGPALEGFCDPWTFSLPYTSGLIYRYRFLATSADYQEGPVFDSGALNTFPEDYDTVPRFTATVGSTGLGFTHSTIPVAWLSRDADLVVNEPATFRVHTIGFVPAPLSHNWHAMDWAENGSCCREVFLEPHGGESFTFTPTRESHYVVYWSSEIPTDDCGANGCPSFIFAGLDPIARAPDTTAPKATKPGRSFPNGKAMLNGTIPTRINWSGSDAGSGIARFELHQQRDGGAWATVSTNLTKTLTDRSLATESTYRFRVRAVDKSGNVGAWVYGDTFRVSRFSEFNSRISYRGSWHTSSYPVFWGGAAKASSTAGSRATLTFTGRAVAWIASKGPTRGKADVYVNGSKVATVDLYSPTAKHQQVVWSGSWSTAASRTVRIQVQGTAGRPRVDLDAFVTVN
jgi:hypothetical protein